MLIILTVDEAKKTNPVKDVMVLQNPKLNTKFKYTPKRTTFTYV